MNETEIKTSIRMLFRISYDKVNFGMEKFNGTLSCKKVELLMLNIHTTWCCHLTTDKNMMFRNHMIYQIMKRLLLNI